MKTLRFVFAVHNHQPVGNFDHVFARATDDAYKPFLDHMAQHPTIPFCAHYSGPLLEWLAANRIEVLLQLERQVRDGRLELLGGGFCEPIFAMLPERDRVSQIERMTDFLRSRFGCAVRGAWLPERVWEPRLVSDFAAAGIAYTVVDDAHLAAAGVGGDRLLGPHLTEDQGRLLTVFNIRERLRYQIPFENDVDRIFDDLRALASEDGRRVVVYADDGEKLGLWPHTRRHVYENGWLERFLKGLESNAGWLRTTTFSRVLAEVPPLDRVYLPVAAYREMNEWALPTETAIAYHRQTGRLQREGTFDALAPFLRAGLWHNFRAKYPESNWMYGRMLDVSDQVDQMPKRGKAYPGAQADLHRAQCNCAYWHGPSGGLYLPHLRASIYHHLIAAESQAAAAAAPAGKAYAAGFREHDIDLDGRPEVVLSSDALNVIVAPSRGGQVMEIDLRDRQINLLATLARRKEWYHPALLDKARQDRPAGDAGRALADHLVEDAHLRASLVDHVYAPDATADDVAASRAEERGDFVHGAYAHETHRTDGGVCLRLERDGAVLLAGKRIPLRIEKILELDAAANELVARYTLELTGRSAADLLFAVELNVALLSDDGGQRYVHAGNRKPIGSIGDRLDLPGRRQLYIVDAWQGFEMAVTCSPAADFWTYPVRTVSQSEASWELHYQSTVILPRWRLRLEPGRPWQARLAQRFGRL
jgi:alpha-amylase